MLIGSGLALSPIHNRLLTDLATNDSGEVVFFLPAFGYLLLVMGAGMFILSNWGRIKAEGLGDKKVWIPLAVIVAAIGLSGITTSGVQDKIAPLGMGLALFALYVATRTLGKDVFLPLAIGAGAASLGIIAHQLVYPGQATGGFVFERNYDIATGYILLGAALLYRKWQWPLALGAVAALLLSGSAEAVFAIAVVGIVVLARRDWSRKLAVAAGSLALVCVVFFATGLGATAYNRALWALTEIAPWLPIEAKGTANAPPESVPLAGRIATIKKAMTNIKPLGDNYNLTGFDGTTVHNVPLIIIQQLGWPGILAALAWLWVSFWLLTKSKLKYAWTLILALSVFDHFIWTQLAPLWWMVAGLSTIGIGGSDLLFKRKQEEALCT